MDGSLFPAIIYVVTQLFDQFGYEMSLSGLVLATNNLDTGRPKVASICADARKRLTLKRKNKRRPQFEKTSLQRLMNSLDAIVKLAKAVSGFSLGLRLKIRYKLGFECLAVALGMICQLASQRLAFLLRSSACRSTISRVIRSFSNLVFP